MNVQYWKYKRSGNNWEKISIRLHEESLITSNEQRVNFAHRLPFFEIYWKAKDRIKPTQHQRKSLQRDCTFKGIIFHDFAGPNKESLWPSSSLKISAVTFWQKPKQYEVKRKINFYIMSENTLWFLWVGKTVNLQNFPWFVQKLTQFLWIFKTFPDL